MDLLEADGIVKAITKMINQASGEGGRQFVSI